MWHCFFSVAVHSRDRLYPQLLPDWSSLEAPEYLCVPSPSVFAYLSARWNDPQDPCIHTVIADIARSEWAVSVYMAFLHAAYYGMAFFTKSKDRRLYDRMHLPPGYRGILFYLSPTLQDLIRAMGIPGIVDGTEYGDTGVRLLDGFRTVNWTSTPGWVWFEWETDTVMPFPRDQTP